MSAYGPLLAALIALLVGLTIGKAWERYKLRDGKWIDRRRARQSPHYILGLNFLVANQIDLAIEELSKAASLDADALEGQVRYQGGNLAGLLASGPDKLTPEHFRLRPDSAGYRAGKDGKDLGADVDLVGPGPAYERWKKTPDYQEWLKETGQQKE